MSIGKIKLDKNYLPVQPKTAIYKDYFDDVVELILKEESSGRINREQAAFLLSLALRNEMTTDIQTLLQNVSGNTKRSEKTTLFMQLINTKRMAHA